MYKIVLINGVAGEVGHIAVQLAKCKGTRVIPIASGNNEVLLRDLGAGQFFDYTTITPEDLVSDVDFALDSVGGPTTDRFLRTQKRGGALVPVFPLGFCGTEEAKKMGVTASTTQVCSSGAQMKDVARLLDAGTVRVALDKTFPVPDARMAHGRAANGHLQVKMILTVA